MSALRIVDSWASVADAGVLAVVPADDWDFARRVALDTLQCLQTKAEVAKNQIANRVRQRLLEEEHFPPEEVEELSPDDLIACLV
ncbi:MAG TPA: hypothetical protein VLG69_04730 [Candidatus Andersenbacteria bacterium]|nr:hypothetical protein [Candidatus Andersenbacteria bacterium]